MRKPLAFVLLAFLLPACSVKASFVASDTSYQAARGGREPAVYLSAAPTAPYRVVGTVALYGVDEDEPEDGLDAAVAKGRAYGCDVLVERSVHERAVNGEGTAAAGLSADAAYVGMEGPGPSVNIDLEQPSVNVDLGDGRGRRDGRRELVCGVWQTQAPTPAESAVPDATEPPALPAPTPTTPEPVPVEI